MIKEELQASILEAFEEEDLNLNEEVKNAKEVKDGISLVKKYENLLKGANKKIINIVGKQGKLLKIFKDEDDFFDCIVLSFFFFFFFSILI